MRSGARDHRGRASYVTHGSKLLAAPWASPSATYDARGHGESDPAPAGEEYDVRELARDMGAVVESQVGAGRGSCSPATRWARTRRAAFALAEPDRVAGLVAIGPASRGEPPASDETIAYWDRLADGLERGGVDGFVEVYDDGSHDPEWRDVVLRLARQRLGAPPGPERGRARRFAR